MKKLIKFPLVLVLSISLLFLCSFLFSNTQAQVSLEKANLGDNMIRIQTNTQNPIIDIQLLENTDTCFINCHAVLKIRTYKDITLPTKANSEFDWNFEKEKPWMDGLVSHHFEILETTEYKVEIPEYGKILINSTCFNEDNTTYECQTEPNSPDRLARGNQIQARIQAVQLLGRNP